MPNVLWFYLSFSPSLWKYFKYGHKSAQIQNRLKIPRPEYLLNWSLKRLVKIEFYPLLCTFEFYIWLNSIKYFEWNLHWCRFVRSFTKYYIKEYLLAHRKLNCWNFKFTRLLSHSLIAISGAHRTQKNIAL